MTDVEGTSPLAIDVPSSVHTLPSRSQPQTLRLDDPPYSQNVEPHQQPKLRLIDLPDSPNVITNQRPNARPTLQGARELPTGYTGYPQWTPSIPTKNVPLPEAIPPWNDVLPSTPFVRPGPVQGVFSVNYNGYPQWTPLTPIGNNTLLPGALPSHFANLHPQAFCTTPTPHGPPQPLPSTPYAPYAPSQPFPGTPYGPTLQGPWLDARYPQLTPPAPAGNRSLPGIIPPWHYTNSHPQAFHFTPTPYAPPRPFPSTPYAPPKPFPGTPYGPPEPLASVPYAPPQLGPMDTPWATPRIMLPYKPFNSREHAHSETLVDHHTESHVELSGTNSSAPTLNHSTSMFVSASEFTISGGQFNNVQGDQEIHNHHSSYFHSTHQILLLSSESIREQAREPTSTSLQSSQSPDSALDDDELDAFIKINFEVEKSESTPILDRPLGGYAQFGGPLMTYAKFDGSSVEYTGLSGPSAKCTEFDESSVGCTEPVFDDEYAAFSVKGDYTPASLEEEKVLFITEEERVYALLESMESKLYGMQSILKQEIAEVRRVLGLPECDNEVIPFRHIQWPFIRKLVLDHKQPFLNLVCSLISGIIRKVGQSNPSTKTVKPTQDMAISRRSRPIRIFNDASVDRAKPRTGALLEANSPSDAPTLNHGASTPVNASEFTISGGQLNNVQGDQEFRHRQSSYFHSTHQILLSSGSTAEQVRQPLLTPPDSALDDTNELDEAEKPQSIPIFGSPLSERTFDDPPVEYVEFSCCPVPEGDDTPAFEAENILFMTEEERVYALLESMENKLDRMQSILKQEIEEIRSWGATRQRSGTIPAYPMAFCTQ
ncbi:hypothetical protein Moror_3268 [Moniliophthora roreri MCA 2997]|uniref:Uncharacterized protein n=1 Tax=Moniliophthora roreri (strain MCA 2997) TaxID=1381753 RepID=V2WSQ6_MONRO|nr:hypothetical protein Moror_3268 [Moniliophthora roreri MCA 2997]